MPVYFWKGIDLKGELQSGIMFAASYEALDEVIKRRSLGLLGAQLLKRDSLLSALDQQSLCRELSSLLTASIPLPTALSLVANLTKKQYVKKIVEGIGYSVSEGALLSEALISYRCADELMLAIVRAGEQGGDLSGTLTQLSLHKEALERLKKKVRVAVRVPCFTLFFFMLTIGAVLVLLVPRFELFYQFSSNTLPAATQAMLKLSSFMRSYDVLYSVCGFFVCSGIITLCIQSPHGKLVKDKLLLKIPGIRLLIRTLVTARVVRILSLLVVRGVALQEALSVCSEVSSTGFVQEEVNRLIHRIEQGYLLSEAVKHGFFDFQELYVCIVLGESSGQLGEMLTKGADLFEQRVYALLDWYIAWINPVLLLFLGVLIAAFITAVYMPLITAPLSIEWG